jgi:predicted transcriptional regulator YdeE
MANIYESNGKIAEAYGVRLPKNYNGQIPENMLVLNIPEMEYVVFEHGPFDFEEECETVDKKLEETISGFDLSKTEYKSDTSSGRIGYRYFDPESFEKRIKPVIKK